MEPDRSREVCCDMATVKCPTCRTPVPWGPESPYRPFCSKRCRLIDLGAWLDGSNHIPGPDLDDEQLTRLSAPSVSANDELDG